MPSIVIRDLQVNYGKTIALEKINLAICHGEFIGIIGPNGGGKTTLVKTILGLIQPTYGQVELDPSETVGYVPQRTTFDQMFPITVEEVVLTGHLPKRITIGHHFSKHERHHVKVVMERLGILDLRKRQIGELSGGQMQRVLLARALMNHPTILILDEPTAGVDELSKREIKKMLLKLNENMTILMISHDLDDLEKSAGRYLYVDRQLKVYDGQTTDRSAINGVDFLRGHHD